MANQAWLQRFPKDELSDCTLVLTGDQYMLLQRFRDWSFINGGIPAEETVMVRLANRLCGFSRYKFRKNWPMIESFFEEIAVSLEQGPLKTFAKFFVHPEDEEKRQHRLQLVSKRKLSGALGGTTRWTSENPVCQSTGEETEAQGIANAIAKFSPTATATTTATITESSYEDLSKHHPPAAAAAGAAAAGGEFQQKPVEPTPEAVSNQPPQAQMELIPVPKPLTDQEFQAIAQRAIDLGLAAPTRAKAEKLRKIFADRPVEQIMQLLVRWEGQNSIGLWFHKSLMDFELEARRQQVQPKELLTKRQAAMADSNRRLMDWAPELGRKMGLG